ncbi:MarR family winged helix-turn-helix transcriptional regulator [Actinomycetospora corticicola]|uniref:DNA-binding MarR family transcriptional regulator n=1 Tax=Actinomycetospora corticicola TaxID=663602 RepID=A0A7Y9E1H0_9PSEU|nr:MarR family transcriptional regulator [Actinomycetospora corticicola]NYD39404.1 DNA-binding MarR family transcriptional regulator [Actinomycetospora corticicola]
MADWLTAEEQRAWRRTAAMFTLLPAALDAQLQRDAGLTQFSYLVLAMLSETPGRTMPMSELASMVSSSLSRLSHVVSRLEKQGWVAREPCEDNGRVTMARLTDAGWDKVVAAAPGHAAEVRRLVIDAVGPDHIADLDEITGAILRRLDPGGKMRANPLSNGC